MLLLSVIFFSLQISHLPLDFSGVYQDVFYLNLMSSFAAVASIYVFINFIENRIPVDFVKFFPLMGCSLLSATFFIQL